MYLCPRFQFPCAQKKAFDRGSQLDMSITAVYNGHHAIAYVTIIVRTGAEAKADGPGLW